MNFYRIIEIMAILYSFLVHPCFSGLFVGTIRAGGVG